MNRIIEFIYISIVLLLFYTMIYVFTLESDIGMIDIDIMSVFIILQLFFTAYSWYVLKGSLFDAYMVFIVVFYVFNLSQPVLESLGCAVEFRRLWGGGYGQTNLLYYMATFFSLASANVFHIGAILSTKRKEAQHFDAGVDNTQYLIVFRRVALFFCLISGPFYIYSLIQNFIIVQTFGYVGIYEFQGENRGYELIGGMYEPAMLAFFSSSILLKRNKRLATSLIILTMFLPPLVLGGRSNAMIVFAIIMIIVFCTSKITIRKVAILAIAGSCMLVLMNLIALTRTEEGRSYQALLDANKENENPLVSTIQEMGWSMYPLALTMEAVPAKKDFAYGASFFWAGISLIPNVGIWSGVHPGKKNDPAEWLNEYSGAGYGIGYSMTAGVYNEFGYCGLILMILYGFIFCKFFSNVSKEFVAEKPVKFIIALIILWFSIKFVRNSLNGLSRGLVYYLLPLIYLSKMFYRNKVVKYDTIKERSRGIS